MVNIYIAEFNLAVKIQNPLFPDVCSYELLGVL